jgi:type I restriction-modification system DNA methylase subunit
MINKKASGSYYIPKNIVSFISKIVPFWKPRRIFDPACGSGIFLFEINSILKTESQFLGIDRNKDVLAIAEEKLKSVDIDCKLLAQDFFLIKEGLTDKFDLIISNPPFDKKIKKEIHEIKLRSSEAAFLINSLDYLDKNGHLVFLLPEGILFNMLHSDLRNYLLENFSIEAIISLPIRTFHLSTGIETSILILKNAKQGPNVFFAEYKEQQAENAIIENFIGKKSNNNLSQGFWIDSKQLEDTGNFWTFNFFRVLKDFEEKKSKSKYPLKRLSEIIEIKSELSESGYILLIPRAMPDRDVIFKTEIENEKSLKNYFQCKVLEDLISPQYLKIYLNSEMGKRQRDMFSSGSVMHMITIKGLKSIYIEIPDLKIQHEVVNAEQRIKEVYSKIEVAHYNFKNKIFNYSEILEMTYKFDRADDKDFLYETLLWPLATSYRIATKGSSNINSQLENNFKLFEMIAAFNSIVLLSALPEEDYKENKDYIWDRKNSKYEKVSFGLWVGLYSRLSKIYREMNDDFYQSIPFEKKFYESITNKKIMKKLQPIPQKRNETIGHGGSLSEIIAENTISELNPCLTDIFGILTAYNSLDMIYTQSMKKNNGLYRVRIKKLEGTNYPFAEDEINTEEDMDSEVLYLHNHVTDERLKLISELIKFIQCPECGNWSVYFYSKLEKDYARYISYQNEIHPYSGSKEEVRNFFDLEMKY